MSTESVSEGHEVREGATGLVITEVDKSRVILTRFRVHPFDRAFNQVLGDRAFSNRDEAERYAGRFASEHDADYGAP